MVNEVQSSVIYSNNRMLNSRMTKTEIENSGNQKAIIEFKKANTYNDEYLTPEEIKAYDKECKKQKWKTVALIAGGVIGLVGIGLAIYKGVQMNKALKEAQTTATEIQTALKDTGKSLMTPQFEEAFASHDFSQYGKMGIPLKYPRETLVQDILESIKDLPADEKNKILEKFNLKLGVSNIYEAMKDLPQGKQDEIVQEIRTLLNDKRDVNTIICELAPNAQQELYSRFGLKMNIGDIDGVPILGKTSSGSAVEQKIESLINRFYHENETLVSNPKLKEAFDAVLKDFPEFGITIGKHQHITHLYSVDIHTLEVLKSTLNNPAMQNLSAEDKLVLRLSVLMHDFGKKGNIVTTGHAAISKVDVEKILEHYNLPQTVKDRVINQVANHHWFEYYNKGIINEQGVLDLFKNETDLTIAKAMAKGDFEGVSPVFHRKILHPGKFLTQEVFDIEFAEKLSKIHF